MDKFKTTDNGGLPIQLNDFRFMQDGTSDSFKGLAGAFGVTAANSYILQGCDVTDGGSVWNIAAGYIALEGEVLPVTAHSVTKTLGGGQVHAWQVLSTFDPAGLKTFESGGSFDTYEVREGRVQVVTASPGTYMPMLAENIFDKIVTNLDSSANQFTTIDLNGSTDVVSNDQIDGSGNNIALFNAPGAGSYLHYTQLGKKVTLKYALEGLTLPTSGVTNSASIVISALPWNFAGAISQWGIASGHSPSHGAAVSGRLEVKTTPGSNRLVFRLLGMGGSYLSLNKLYTFDTTTSHIEQVAAGSVNITWNIRGEISFEVA